MALEPKAAGDGGQVPEAEDRSAVRDSVCPQLVDLRPVGTIVEDDDQDLQAGTNSVSSS